MLFLIIKTMQEIWKDIPGYEGVYQVSNLGNVLSTNRYGPHNLRKGKQKNGYVKYALYTKSLGKNILFASHRLVASAFLGLELKFNGNNLVCHKNDIRDDNRVENLFLGTYKENINDKVFKKRHSFGENIKSSKLKENDIINIRKSNEKCCFLSKKYLVSRLTIWNIKKGITWKHLL